MRTSAPMSVVVTDAHIITMDPEQPTARALVIHDGVIDHVGSDEGAKGRDRGVDVRIDAKGRTLLPGFNDAHGHFFHEGSLKLRLDLATATSLDDVYARLRQYAKTHPDDEVLVCERWDESDWPQRVFPTREGLDKASGNRPVLCRRVDGHTAVASSGLLDIYKAWWKGPTEGIHWDTGLLIEEPSLDFGDLVPATPTEIDRALGIAFEEAMKHGVTSLQGYERPEVWRGWQRKVLSYDRRGELPPVKAAVSTYTQFVEHFHLSGLITGTGSPWLRFGGVKIFADGSFGGWSAHLSEPYTDKPDTHGKQNFRDEQLLACVERAQRADVQVQMHAIGDAAIAQGCSIFENVHGQDPEAFRALRHRFEHYEFGTEATHDCVKRLGIVLSMQPNFVGEWCLPDGLYGDRLGDRHGLNNAFRTIFAKRIPLAFGSDNMPFGPIEGIEGTMRAPYDHQRLSFLEAAECYTRGAAYAEHQEAVKGMLRAGLFGDAVLFNKDLRHHDLQDASLLDGLAVERTIADGRVVYAAQQHEQAARLVQ